MYSTRHLDFITGIGGILDLIRDGRKHKVSHQLHNVAGRPVLTGFLIVGLVEAAHKLLEDGAHSMVVQTGEIAARLRAEVNVLADKLLDDRAENVSFDHRVDLIAELFLEGWIDIRGKFSPEKTNLIQKREGQLCIEYAPGLYFYQKDIDEFILTKAAAHIMVEIMLRESGLELNQADRFYVAGSFGKYVSVESAITIGMYPDMEREKMINAGNSSLEGAQKLLLNKELLADIDQILEEMTYIQFAEVDDFLEQMVAAQALPHTDYKKYPTVMEKLKKRQNICFY